MRITLSRNNSVLNTRFCVVFRLVWLMRVTMNAVRLGLVLNTSLVVLYDVLSRWYGCDNIGLLRALANAKIGLEISICLT